MNCMGLVAQKVSEAIASELLPKLAILCDM